MSLRPPTRRQTPLGPGRRTPRVRRASSARLTPIRAGAALVMLASLGALYGVSSSSAFDYARVRLTATPVWTDPAAVEAAIAGARGQNLFRISTDPLETELERLPTVERAHIGVEFPDTLAVTLDERTPILIWKVGDLKFLVDADGKLFAELPDVPGAATAGLPVVDDGRSASAGLIAGSTLDPVDLDAATRLASLVPADVGSQANGLSIVLTDENGFLLRSDPRAWTAVFGIYTPTIRTPDLIPEQVRLLRSLLAGREDTVERVILASGTEGTYIPRPTPTPSATPKPTPKPSAKPTPKPSAKPTARPTAKPSASTSPSAPG
jgi:cell division septal protein FtsQ